MLALGLERTAQQRSLPPPKRAMMTCYGAFWFGVGPIGPAMVQRKTPMRRAMLLFFFGGFGTPNFKCYGAL